MYLNANAVSIYAPFSNASSCLKSILSLDSEELSDLEYFDRTCHFRTLRKLNFNNMDITDETFEIMRNGFENTEHNYNGQFYFQNELIDTK